MKVDLANTRPRGRKGGRHAGSFNIVKANRAKDLYLLGVPIKVICQEVYIARSTLYNYLKHEGLNNESYIRNSFKFENLKN